MASSGDKLKNSALGLYGSMFTKKPEEAPPIVKEVVKEMVDSTSPHIEITMPKLEQLMSRDFFLDEDKMVDYLTGNYE